jgi:hypothetical protein
VTRLDEIRARLAAARGRSAFIDRHKTDHDVMAFLDMASTDIAYLLAEVDRLRKALPTAEELRTVRWFTPHESTTRDEINAMRAILARLDAATNTGTK